MAETELKSEIEEACRVLSKGGVILYPTDTIWGIGCDATNEKAVKRIFEIKRREDSKSMLILIDSPDYLHHYVDDPPEVAYDLINLSDKPLTIVYSGARNLASNLIAEDGTIGIRVTNELFSQMLCRRFKKPIVSTSANLSGGSSPGNFSGIDETIKNAVDYVVNYRREEKNKSNPSGIIKLGKNGQVQVIRP